MLLPLRQHEPRLQRLQTLLPRREVEQQSLQALLPRREPSLHSMLLALARGDSQQHSMLLTVVWFFRHQQPFSPHPSARMSTSVPRFQPAPVREDMVVFVLGTVVFGAGAPNTHMINVEVPGAPCEPRLAWA